MNIGRFKLPYTAVTAMILLLLGLFVLLINVNFVAAAEVNRTLSFNGRLLDNSGVPVPDGHYNMQFKIYEGGSGAAAGNPDGSLKWTENYVNDNSNSAVAVTNGYFSVNLGSVNNFGSSIDWNNSTLWLSMNIAGSDNSCTVFGSSPCLADGEMLPMRRITATPYAINSGMLDGKSAEQFIQLGQGSQQDASDNSSIFINKTGSGDLIQLQNNASDVFAVSNTGDIMFGNGADHSIAVAQSNTDMAGMQLILAAGQGGGGTGSAGGNVVISGGASGGTDANGGNIVLSGGNGSGTGAQGLVIMNTPTLATAEADANCYTGGAAVADSCSVSLDSLNGSAAILVGLSVSDKTVTVPDPTLTTAGRVIYIMAAGSENFTLQVNDAGDSEQTVMRPNTATALIWDGANWTIASTSSTNTLMGDTTTDGTVANVQIGDGTDDGDVTLLSLDEAMTAPTITNTSGMIGSMYYDSSLGEIQCYNASGWGDCLNKPDTFVTVSPEYPNAVMNGYDLGTVTSDFCSDTLNINDGSSSQPTICGVNETYNFYGWTSSESTDQTRSIYLNYVLPNSFKDFVDGSLSLMARTDAADATVAYQVYRDDGQGLTACGSEITASTGAKTTWQQATAAAAADPANCSFSSGDSILIRINLTSKNDANAYISNLNFTFSNL